MLRFAVFSAAAAVLLSACADAQVVSLTQDNFDSVALNGGKNAFVKFLAPW